jgi:hypothetical protein
MLGADREKRRSTMKPMRVQFIIRKAISILIFFLAIGLSDFSSHAAEISGVKFDDSYHDQGIRMRLQGTGLKTMLFFRAFVAGYYTNMAKATDPLGEIPKRIEVEYFVNIPGKKLNNYTIEQIKANISDDQFNQLKDKIKLMSEYFVDLKSGDRFSLTYIPGVGTKFAHNDQLTGIIEGSEFGKAIFSVWIGDKPFDSHLKQQVLGLNPAT